MEPNSQTKPSFKPMPEYRFVFKIVDDETGETIIKASTYLGEIDNMGNCESVDIEVGTTLRNFEKTLRPNYEKETYQKETNQIEN